jgi:hypothetical protein
MNATLQQMISEIAGGISTIPTFNLAITNKAHSQWQKQRL